MEGEERLSLGLIRARVVGGVNECAKDKGGADSSTLKVPIDDGVGVTKGSNKENSDPVASSVTMGKGKLVLGVVNKKEVLGQVEKNILRDRSAISLGERGLYVEGNLADLEVLVGNNSVNVDVCAEEVCFDPCVRVIDSGSVTNASDEGYISEKSHVGSRCRLKRLARRRPSGSVVQVNLGKNEGVELDVSEGEKKIGP
ncbi:hypothetical protein ACOSQ3_019146 [Xanthoceras sorbifolium]